MTMLAEQGIVGTIPTILLFWFLFAASYKLAFTPSVTWRNGKWALIAAACLLLRAGVEEPGLFGYFQEPADFLAFSFLAIVVSSHSREEDWLNSDDAAALGEAAEVSVPTEEYVV
jgi:hypothetical protein